MTKTILVFRKNKAPISADVKVPENNHLSYDDFYWQLPEHVAKDEITQVHCICDICLNEYMQELQSMLDPLRILNFNTFVPMFLASAKPEFQELGKALQVLNVVLTKIRNVH